jgi:hypothetical protein
VAAAASRATDRGGILYSARVVDPVAPGRREDFADARTRTEIRFRGWNLVTCASQSL